MLDFLLRGLVPAIGIGLVAGAFMAIANGSRYDG